MNALILVILEALNIAATSHPGVEAAGAVYQCEGQPAFYSTPVPGEEDRATVRIYRQVNGCPLVATYHTHPAGSELFSRQDIAMACQLKVPFYMLPAGGKARVFDCRGLLKPVWQRAHEEPRLARGKAVQS
jgi:proteasome lid subunit RPN8/RPN11